MSSVRKKALEDFAKDVEKGIPFSEGYIKKTGSVYDDALRARNLAEESLAQKVLDNTGIPIPDKTATISKKEDFLNRILQENYPEIKNPIQLKDLDNAHGLYSNGNIYLNKKSLGSRDVQKTVADVFHEGGHSYDELKKLLTPDNTDDFYKELRKLKASGVDLKNADPTHVYELMAKAHHAQIPNLREGTYGLGALKNYLKTGTFKMLPFVGPAIAAGTAIASKDAAAAIPILNEAESLGPEKGTSDYEIENPQASPELRKAALQKLMGR